MEGLPILNTIGGILLYFAKLVVLMASIIAFYKKRNTGSFLLLIGSIAIILADILGIFLIIYAGNTSVMEVVKYTGINSIISAITYIIFALGLLLFIIQIVKLPVQKDF